jgi:hypothetical protein
MRENRIWETAEVPGIRKDISMILLAKAGKFPLKTG